MTFEKWYEEYMYYLNCSWHEARNMYDKAYHEGYMEGANEYAPGVVFPKREEEKKEHD